MHKIGRGDLEDLATAIIDLLSSESYDLLWNIFFCIRMYKEPRLPDVLKTCRNDEQPLMSYYLAGLEAYTHESRPYEDLGELLLQFVIERFDPMDIYSISQTRELIITVQQAALNLMETIRPLKVGFRGGTVGFHCS
ncbi:hypothetical protein BDP27DRAFT_1428409 [Rhodocollybia butyracea]|uniref:Uncharacterized protein n=1 Tax=Rhodocollybia butyracea TaxID=206335 RepID=A0A9P5PFV2_9AGAR|nr:hypothetical protein BDP27DRAFT_1428409 [Rhodocollybia butyracea]